MTDATEQSPDQQTEIWSGIKRLSLNKLKSIMGTNPAGSLIRVVQSVASTGQNDIYNRSQVKGDTAYVGNDDMVSIWCLV